MPPAWMRVSREAWSAQPRARRAREQVAMLPAGEPEFHEGPVVGGGVLQRREAAVGMEAALVGRAPRHRVCGRAGRSGLKRSLGVQVLIRPAGVQAACVGLRNLGTAGRGSALRHDPAVLRRVVGGRGSRRPARPCRTLPGCRSSTSAAASRGIGPSRRSATSSSAAPPSELAFGTSNVAVSGRLRRSGNSAHGIVVESRTRRPPSLENRP